MADSPGYGQQTPNDSASDFNSVAFVIRQMMARMSTMKLVQVKAVTGGGTVAAAGTVDVQPLVSQVDGNNNATPQGTVFGIPWFRLYGGSNAVICDPKVGDIGFVVVSDRDISAVKRARAVAAPGSYRRFDIADGVYVGGVLAPSPTQYVLFASDRIEVSSPQKINLLVGSASAVLTTSSVTLAFGSNSIVVDATGIHFIGPTFFNGIASGATTGALVDFGASQIKTTGNANVGSVTSAGDVTAGGKSLDTHQHNVAGVQAGGSTIVSSAPI